MEKTRLPKVRNGLADLRKTWGQLFLLTVVTHFAVTLPLLPAQAVVLRVLMAINGTSAFRETEIAGFFLSPIRRLALLVVAGFWIDATLIESSRTPRAPPAESRPRPTA